MWKVKNEIESEIESKLENEINLNKLFALSILV